MSAQIAPIDAATTSLQDLEQDIAELAGHLNAGAYRLVTLIGEFDRRGGWAHQGITSCAHWLNWKIGLDMGAAREKVRVARALPELPKTSVAFSAGKISYSKVRAMTRIATPANEDDLLNIALHGTAHHMETLVRRMRYCERAEQLQQANKRDAARSVSWHYDDTGQLQLRASLPPEVGALLVEALRAAENSSASPEDVSAETSALDLEHSDDTTRLAENRRADALGLLAESYLAGKSDTSRDGNAYQVVVHVSAETLRDDASVKGREDCCELEHGPGLTPETARRLACDASLVGLFKNSLGEALDVGRKTRSIPTAMRRALVARDRGCRFPGCTHTRYVDGHHIQHWAQGGETKLSNLVLLCRRHHRLIHEGGFSLRREAARLVFRDRDEQLISTHGHTSDTRLFEGENIAALVAAHVDKGLQIDAQTAVTAWRGEPMDYDWAIDGLMQQREACDSVSARR